MRSRSWTWTEATMLSGMGGSSLYRRDKGSHTARSGKTTPTTSFEWPYSKRMRPSQISVGSQRRGPCVGWRKKLAARSIARAAGALGWGASAGWKPSGPALRKPRSSGEWRER
uniref:Uncharacterized protein n=1 Tax=Arundo donax TaxID=35708 RepID=A0A0A9HGH4_ARUDO